MTGSVDYSKAAAPADILYELQAGPRTMPIDVPIYGATAIVGGGVVEN